MNVRLEGNWKFLNTPSLVNFERRAIGYDRLFKRIIDMPENDNQSYPPHNLIKESDTEFKIELALAGFSKKEVKVVQEEQRLTISGNNSEEEGNENILHKGIARISFLRNLI